MTHIFANGADTPSHFHSLTRGETSEEATGGTSTAEATSREDTTFSHADTLGKKTINKQ